MSADTSETSGEGRDGEAVESPRRLTSSRTEDHAAQQSLLQAVQAEPWGYNFFALIRRIEALHPHSPGFGRSDFSQEDPVRFCQEPSLAFAPCTVSQLKFQTDKAATRLFVHFMGLLGPNGPLPLHMTEFARERERHHKDPTLARFLDLFNHRMVGLFYRAWAASQMTASFDRWEAPLQGQVTLAERELQLARDTNRYSTYIGSLFGLGMESLRHRDAVPDVAKLHFAGRLSSQQHNAEGLRAILRSYLKLPVEIEEFSGRFAEVPKQYHCSLGVVPPSGKSAGQLGGLSGGAMCGSTFFDCAGAFRIRIGPMSFREYLKLIPGTPAARRIATWIRNYVGDELWWDAQLVVKQNEVPSTCLGVSSHLGWTTWVLSKKSTEDRADLTLRSKF